MVFLSFPKNNFKSYLLLKFCKWAIDPFIFENYYRFHWNKLPNQSKSEENQSTDFFAGFSMGVSAFSTRIHIL